MHETSAFAQTCPQTQSYSTMRVQWVSAKLFFKMPLQIHDPSSPGSLRTRSKRASGRPDYVGWRPTYFKFPNACISLNFTARPVLELSSTRVPATASMVEDECQSICAFQERTQSCPDPSPQQFCRPPVGAEVGGIEEHRRATAQSR